ncbi:hypothetical protein CEXT_49291 [Caerostris extrusa]|uniref:Uncharacterized protein n=1 Tax=Caerostris extrusa TaxID=172846 RepID=A0AAV4XQT9_CAEEX|nr:hypothetical protein CEXT_49291 [Caerostris extrusa]
MATAESPVPHGNRVGLSSRGEREELSVSPRKSRQGGANKLSDNDTILMLLYTTIFRTDVEKYICQPLMCRSLSMRNQRTANCLEWNGMPRSRLLTNDTSNPQRAGKISPAAKPDRDP